MFGSGFKTVVYRNVKVKKIINNLFSYVMGSLVLIPLFIVLLIIVGKPFYMVQPGFNIIHLRFGKVVQNSEMPGLYYKFPFIDSAISIDKRIKKSVIKTEAFSKDLQSVDIEVAINYRIKDALYVYSNIGLNYENVIVDPFTQENVKAVIAKFTAEDLTQNRHEAKEMVKRDLEAALRNIKIELVDFNFIHTDFQDEFIKAVENKQIAEQEAKRSKYYTEKVKEEALQTRVRSEAEAYSLQVQKANVTTDLIELKKIEARLKAIEKWNGVLPKVQSESASFVKLSEGI